MLVSRLKLKNWKNFRDVEVTLRDRVFVVGPNASGKSNLLDVFRFLRDLAKPAGGGLQQAVNQRGGVTKLRCLAARSDPEILVEVDLAEDASEPPKWTYTLGFKSEGTGKRRVFVSQERVLQNSSGKGNLSRPDLYDKKDKELLTQTHLEQIKTNVNFREVAKFFAKTTYLHLVPQILRHPDQLAANKLEDDPFGQAFLDRIARTTERVRDARLKRIEKALRVCVPQMRNLRFEEERGRPHLQALYKHWRPDAGWQSEDQFSDGTLRLLGIMWMLLDGDTTLLLEEPELSLDEQIVTQIPALISEMQRIAKHRRQIFITTHSKSMLSDSGIDASEVLYLEPDMNGTKIPQPSKIELQMMESGLSAADVFMSKSRPQSARSQLSLLNGR
ncbi:MAG: AAA family ATPase [SAR324 cluster bacterium]